MKPKRFCVWHVKACIKYVEKKSEIKIWKYAFGNFKLSIQNFKAYLTKNFKKNWFMQKVKNGDQMTEYH